MLFRRLAVLFALALVLAAGLCFANPGPKDVGRAGVGVRLNWTVSFGWNLPTEAVFSAYGFPNTSNQKAVFSSNRNFSAGTDEFGNTVLNFTFLPLNSSEEIVLDAVAETNYEPSTVYEDADAPDSVFLEESSFVVFDSAIRTLAGSVVSGAPDDFEKLARLTEWTHTHVEYDKKAAFTFNLVSALNSRQVLDIRKGVCKEYAHLLLGFLRAEKIPARYVVGFVYNGEEWGPHSWVEAAIDGKWIPSDPTFGEAGVIDGTHVVMAYGRDQNDTKLTLLTKGRGDLGQMAINTEQSAEFLYAEDFSEFFGLDVSYPSSERGSGSRETVSAAVSNKAGKPLAIPLSLSVCTEFRVLDAPSKLVYLKPDEERRVSWNVLYFEAMQPGYVYSCPSAVSGAAQLRNFSLSGRADSEKNVEEGAELRDFSASMDGRTLTISVAVANNGNTIINNAQAMLWLENGFAQNKSVSIFPGESKQLVYSAQVSPGQEELVINLTVFLEKGELELRRKLLVAVATPTPTPSEAPQPTAPPKVPGKQQPSPQAGGTDYQAVAVIGMGVLLVLLLVIFFTKKPAAEYREP